MKRHLLLSLFVVAFVLPRVHAQDNNSGWTDEKAKSWMKKKDWLQGLSATPDATIDPVKFATRYHQPTGLGESILVFKELRFKSPRHRQAYH